MQQADHDERGRALLEAMTAYSSNSRFQLVAGSDHGTILSNESYAQQISSAVVELVNATIAPSAR